MQNLAIKWISLSHWDYVKRLRKFVQNLEVRYSFHLESSYLMREPVFVIKPKKIYFWPIVTFWQQLQLY